MLFVDNLSLQDIAAYPIGNVEKILFRAFRTTKEILNLAREIAENSRLWMDTNSGG